MSDLQIKKPPKKYAILCHDSKAQRSILTNEIQTINNCELRLQLRPHVDMPKYWSWSNRLKDLRPATTQTQFQNYRYGSSDASQLGYYQTTQRHRRYQSAPEISTTVKPKSSQTLPHRPQRFSLDGRQSKKGEKKASLMNPEAIFYEEAMNMQRMKDEQASKQNELKVNVKEFLGKKNPPMPPESLRIQKTLQFKEGEYIIRNKYLTEKESYGDENVINPSTAPTIQMFPHKTWYYQSKDSWRYLREKDPDPLSVDSIFTKEETKLKA